MMTSQPHFNFSGMNSSLSSTSNSNESASLMNLLLSNNVSNISNNQLYNKLINNHNPDVNGQSFNCPPKTSGPSSPTNLTFEQQIESHMMLDETFTQQLPSSLLIPSDSSLSSLRRTTSYPNKFHSFQQSSNTCKYCETSRNLKQPCMFCNKNNLKSKTPSPMNNCTSPSQSTCNSIISNSMTLSHSNSMEAITDLDRALDGLSPQTPCFLQLDINGLVSELNQSKTPIEDVHNNTKQLPRQLSFNLSTTPFTTFNNNTTTSTCPPQFNNSQNNQNNHIIQQQQQQQFSNAMIERSLKLSTLQRRNSFIVNNRSASSNNLLSAVVKNPSTSPASPTTNTPGNLSPTPSLASLSRKSNSSSSLNNLRGISKQRKTGTLVTETVTTTSSTIHHCVEFPKDSTFVNSSGNSVQQQASSSSNGGNARNQSWTFYKEEAFENEKKNSKNNFKFHNISFVHVPEQ